MKAGRRVTPCGLLLPKSMGQKSLLIFFEDQDLSYVFYFIDK